MTNNIKKIKYYAKGIASHYLMTNSYFHHFKKKWEKQLNCPKVADYIFQRVNYYNRLSHPFILKKNDKNIAKNENTCTPIKNLPHIKMGSRYRYDFRYFLNFFEKKNLISFQMGDVNTTIDHPSICKSRPIKENNENNIIMKLNHLRHFNFIHDKKLYQQKKNKIVWRGFINNKKRLQFLEKFHHHPRCNVAHVSLENEKYYQKKMTIKEQLEYQFLLALEGNDVATSLKWNLSSNSLCMMTQPSCETWFMENTLQPGVHYIQLKPDYSDLEEKMDYYNSHPKEAQEIIQNAHQYIQPFQNKQQENLISLLVLEKYFYLSGQIDTKYKDEFNIS